jgi:hypothetical protein
MGAGREGGRHQGGLADSGRVSLLSSPAEGGDPVSIAAGVGRPCLAFRVDSYWMSGRKSAVAGLRA